MCASLTELRSYGEVRIRTFVPVPRVLWHGRTELTEDSGTGMNGVHNSQKIRVWNSYSTHKFQVRYGRLAELTEVPGRCTTVVPVPRVLWHERDRTHRSSG